MPVEAIHDSDAELARRVAEQQGEPHAEAALCARFLRRAFLYGRRHLRDDAAAQDLAQDVLITVLAALREGRVAEPERIGSFMLGTCRLMAAATRRKEQRRAELRAGLDIEVSVASVDESVDLTKLSSCLQRLADREQRMVRMTFHEDCSVDTIAHELGLETGNVRVLRHRTLARLRRCIEGTSEAAP